MVPFSLLLLHFICVLNNSLLGFPQMIKHLLGTGTLWDAHSNAWSIPALFKGAVGDTQYSPIFDLGHILFEPELSI